LKKEMLGTWTQEIMTAQGIDNLKSKIMQNEIAVIKVLPSKIILTDAVGISIEKPFQIEIQFDWFYGVNGISLKHSEVDSTYLNLLTLLDTNSYLGRVIYRTSKIENGIEKYFLKVKK
jgi:hypothetical protein